MRVSASFFGIICTVCLLPWFIVQSQLSINGDTAWFITAVERMLSGEMLSQTYYDINPPLSLLYNIPPVLLGKFLPFAMEYTIFLYFCGLIALSVWAMSTITKYWPFLEENQRHAILAAWLAGATIFTTIALGEREPVVILGLMPFLMVQLSLTWGYDLPRKILWPVLILGTLAVLIKPHFGLLPTLLLIHRMVLQKRFWTIIRDPDFLALAIGTLSYIAIIWFCFNDYVTVVLRDAFTLYVHNKDYQAALPELFFHAYLFLTFLGVEAFLNPLKGRQKQLLILLYIGAILCLIPYAVQMKGFYYQLIPAIAFFFTAFSLSLQTYAAQYLKKFRIFNPLLIVAIFILSYLNTPLLVSYPKHKDFTHLPLSQEIAKCEKPCNWFIFQDTIEIVHPTAFYAGQQNASRFPSFWFLPILVQSQYALDQGTPALLNQEQIDHYRKHFGDMVAEDLKRYQPKLLLIGQYRLTPEERNFDFGAFFAVSEDFRTQWDGYKYEEVITLNQRPYFTGTALDHDEPMIYAVYTKK